MSRAGGATPWNAERRHPVGAAALALQDRGLAAIAGLAGLAGLAGIARAATGRIAGGVAVGTSEAQSPPNLLRRSLAVSGAKTRSTR